MEYLWKILAFLAVTSAALNIILNILVILRKKMTFNCEAFVTEYIMAAVILLLLLRQLLNDTQIMILFIIFAVIWIATTLIFRLKKLCFVRVYGVKRLMHDKLKEKLEKTANERGLDRTCVYIYGGDKKTPCNTIIFRRVAADERKLTLNSVNKFLETYSSGIIIPRLAALLLDAAVILIIITVL